MPEALAVLSLVLCGMVSAEKKANKALQEKKSQAAGAEMCLAPARKPEASGAEPGSCSGILLSVPVPELQEFIPSSIFPVPPSPTAQAGASGSGRTKLLL